MTNINQFIEENAVNEGFLQEQYQSSVTEDPPVWTDEHITEICGDFYLIPKEAINNRQNDINDDIITKLENLINNMEVYTTGRQNIEKVHISALQLQRFINELKNIKADINN